MSRRTSRFSYLLLLAFPFALFSTTILGKRALFWGTPLNQFVPWWTFSWNIIQGNEFPLWNPLLGMGAPLAANYQSALFYPPTWIYFIAYTAGGIGAMAWFQAVMVVIHLFWAALGMALLIKALRLSRVAQVIGGLAFGLSGYLVARAGFLSINAAATWLPWIILGSTQLVKALPPLPYGSKIGVYAEKPDQKKILSAFLLLVIAISMQLLAGHAQTTWYSMLLAGLWFAFLAFFDPWREKKTGQTEVKTGEVSGSNIDKQKPQARKAGIQSKIWLLALFIGAILLASALAAMQLMPTAEYLLESQRSAAVDYDFAMSYSFWPWRFLSFIAPGLFGNPALGDYWGYANYWEDAVYIGLIPFVLAVTAVVTLGKKLKPGTMVSSRMVWFLLMLITGIFLIALGRNTPIFPWLYRHVPTFDMFQAPTRISILAVFCLSILAAVGADSWSNPHGKQLYWLRLGVMAAAAVTIGAGLALLLTRSMSFEIRPSFIRAAAWLGLWGVCLGLLALKAPAKTTYVKSIPDWGWWQWAVVSVVGINLVITGWGLNPSVGLDVYTDPAPTAERVKNLIGDGRIYLPAEDEELLKFERFLRFDTFQPFDSGEDWRSLRASMLPNITLLEGLPSANNFDPLIPGRYATWLAALEGASSDLQEEMLNLMGVTVVESIDLSEFYGVRFEGREALPRIRWTSCGIPVADAEEALGLIRSRIITHDSEVIIESNAEDEVPVCNALHDAELRILTDTAASTAVKTKSKSAGYLVLADVWFPGWRADVDGKPVDLLRANYLFRAVAVPAGEHEVRIRYQPAVFVAGAAVSATALILLTLLVVLWFRSKESADSEHNQVK